MPTTPTRLVGAAGLSAALICFIGADHADAPGATADPAADIADVYAIHDLAADRLTLVLTFAGLKMPALNQQGTYDDDVLYVINIDTNNDKVADFVIDVRFGQNPAGASGVRVAGLPGAPAVVIGAVETILEPAAGVKVFAGLRDDPFFFDLDGFNATRMSGNLSFDNTRDFFAGTNISAIVLETKLSAVSSTAFSLWATTARATAPTANN
ncbi:MAG: DUF4331 family protein [Planctomycetes bacterium]|nr:DUF4331 family protein [Planctomycetota bacterium]